MKKRMISETILHETKRIPRMVESHQFTWGEVKEILTKKKIVLQDTDTIQIGIEHVEYSHEDAYTEPHYFVTVDRSRLETDKEFNKRKKGLEKRQEEEKEKRRKQYIALKEEFEKE